MCYPGPGLQLCVCYPGPGLQLCVCYPGPGLQLCVCYPGTRLQLCVCYPGPGLQLCVWLESHGRPSPSEGGHQGGPLRQHDVQSLRVDWFHSRGQERSPVLYTMVGARLVYVLDLLCWKVQLSTAVHKKGPPCCI